MEILDNMCGNMPKELDVKSVAKYWQTFNLEHLERGKINVQKFERQIALLMSRVALLWNLYF